MARLTIFTLARWASIASVALAGIAMLLYPGGTLHDPSTTGYSFFQNFLSDLGGTVAWGGQPNYLSAFLFVTSFRALRFRSRLRRSSHSLFWPFLFIRVTKPIALPPESTRRRSDLH